MTNYRTVIEHAMTPPHPHPHPSSLPLYQTPPPPLPVALLFPFPLPLPLSLPSPPLPYSIPFPPPPNIPPQASPLLLPPSSYRMHDSAAVYSQSVLFRADPSLTKSTSALGRTAPTERIPSGPESSRLAD